jgi:Superfamily II helicase and inactivated derivatives
VNVPESFGWQVDGSFVLSERVYYPDGSVRHVPMAGMENITRNTKMCGSLEEWRRYVNLFIAREMWGHLGIGCVGFGAPLMRFTGLDGLTFHACSDVSGSGKSLALDMASSIWGHPQYYRTGSGTSDVALQQRAGLLHSMPLLSDEITDKQRAAPEWLPGFLLAFSQGRGKERMETGANKERLNTSTWSTLCVLTSNTYGMDYLSGGRSHASHGEIYRMLEWVHREEYTWDTVEVEVMRSLRSNYGLAGEKYIQWLVKNEEVAKGVVMACLKRVTDVMDARGPERFWMGGIAACLAGAILAGKKYADVVDLPVEKLFEFYRGLVRSARVSETSSHRSAEDMLNEYTKEFYGSIIVIRDKHILLNDTDIGQSVRVLKVMGRIEYGKDGVADYFIAEGELKKFCNTKSFGYADFKTELAKKYRVFEMRKDLLKDVKGPAMRVNALRITMPVQSEVDFTDV